MVITKLVGRTTNFKGKTLWEIVGNLKNFGVGRVVVRSTFERYPEPSFMKIIKVEPQPSNDELRKVKVTVQKTFRGRTLPNTTEILRTSYKPDYRLLPKDEEADYCKITKCIPEREITTKLAFPPLLKEYVLRDYMKKGIKVPDDMFLHVNYSHSPNKVYKPNKNASEVLPIDQGRDPSKHLYSEQKTG